MKIPVALSLVVRQLIHDLANHGDTATHIEIRLTPDAVPRIDMRELAAIRTVDGIPIVIPEQPSSWNIPRTVQIRAIGTNMQSDQWITAECWTDCYRVEEPC